MTEDEILQISNDISEDMLSRKVTKAQLVKVIEFFRNKSDEIWERFQQAKSDALLNAIINPPREKTNDNGLGILPIVPLPAPCAVSDLALALGIQPFQIIAELMKENIFHPIDKPMDGCDISRLLRKRGLQPYYIAK